MAVSVKLGRFLCRVSTAPYRQRLYGDVRSCGENVLQKGGSASLVESLECARAVCCAVCQNVVALASCGDLFDLPDGLVSIVCPSCRTAHLFAVQARRIRQYPWRDDPAEVPSGRSGTPDRESLPIARKSRRYSSQSIGSNERKPTRARRNIPTPGSLFNTFWPSAVVSIHCNLRPSGLSLTS